MTLIQVPPSDVLMNRFRGTMEDHALDRLMEFSGSCVGEEQIRKGLREVFVPELLDTILRTICTLPQ